MPLCPNCHQWYEVSHSAGGCAHCAAGGAAAAHSTRDEGEGPVPVARFRNWAEAGYFEDLLHSHGIAAQLEPQEQYDAVGGHWGHQLMLSVAGADFDRARDLMQQELEDNEDDAGTRAQRADPAVACVREPRDVAGSAIGPSATEGPPLWKPLAVVLVAGGLAYLGTHGLRWARPGPAAGLEGRPASRSSDLWRYLMRNDGVWQRELGPGAGRARMWQDGHSGTLHIEEDRDGDGLFERHLQFQGGRRLEQRRVAPVPAAPNG